jgi:PKD repeat protein
MMRFTLTRRAAVFLALLASAGCTVKNTEAPPLSGPSSLALLLTVNAIPDSIRQDGGDQSSIRITAIGPDGKPVSALPIRVDMIVDGVPQDFGTLSARSVVTNGDGVATVIYTAPPSPVNGIFGNCSGLPGNCVSIVATATASNFATARPQTVQIRLVPTGVIQPPATTPTAAFTFSPTPVNFNVPVIFDASSSCAGPLSGSSCSSTSTITSYAWNFGDGSSGTGKTVSHTFSGSATSFIVALTVTTDRGLSATTSQTVTAANSPAPAGDWVFSPAAPNVGETVFFNGDPVKPAPGHTIVQSNWNFGDPTSSTNSAGGLQTTHAFLAAGTYTVVLTVTDDASQKTVLPKTVTIGSGSPTAALTVSKTGGLTVQADGSASSSSGGTTITTYTFNFGDGTASVSGTNSIVPHTYAVLGTYTVRLTVTDSLGRTGTSSSSVSVP